MHLVACMPRSSHFYGWLEDVLDQLVLFAFPICEIDTPRPAELLGLEMLGEREECSARYRNCGESAQAHRLDLSKVQKCLARHKTYRDASQ